MNFEDVGAMLHDNLESGHREPRRLVHATHSGILPATTGATSIPGV